MNALCIHNNITDEVAQWGLLICSQLRPEKCHLQLVFQTHEISTLRTAVTVY